MIERATSSAIGTMTGTCLHVLVLMRGWAWLEASNTGNWDGAECGQWVEMHSQAGGDVCIEKVPCS